MGEPAVRTTLSGEGIKTIAGTNKGKKNQVRNDEAIAWLLGRRNFVPTMRFGDQANDSTDVVYSLFNADSLPFEVALKKSFETTSQSKVELLQQADVDAAFVELLLSPNQVPMVDVGAFERLAAALKAPVPVFVGKPVTTILVRRDQLRENELCVGAIR